MIGNGDIWEVEDALKMLNETGVRGLMCGRGAVRDPFLFTKLAKALKGEIVSANQEELKEFFFTLLDIYQTIDDDKEKKLGMLKEFTTWFCRHPLIGKEFFQQVKRSQTYQELRESALNYFQDTPIKIAISA